MKFSDILKTANSNLRRSKARTILTIIAIFIGAFTLTLTNGIGAGINRYIDQQMGNIGADDMLVVQAKTDTNPFGGDAQKYDPDESTSNVGGFPMRMLTKADLDTIRAQQGITSADFDYNIVISYITGSNNEKFKLQSAGSYYDGLNLTLVDGRTPDNSSKEPQVVLGSGDQRYLGFESAQDAIGKTVTFGVKKASGEVVEVKATVVGVQAQTLMSAAGALVNKPLLDEIYSLQTEGLPANITEQQPVITARFDTNLSEKELADLKQSLSDKGYDASTIEDQIGIFKQVISAIVMVLNFFAGIALLAASFGIVNTLLMAVQERTREIGLMKAMGMGRRKIFGLFATEAILIGFWGSLLGVLAGVGAGNIANAIAARTFLKDLIGFKLTAFPLTNLAFVVLLVMSIAFVAGTLPARRASKKDPIEALRTE